MHPFDEDEEVLHGTFAELVREGIDSLIDHINERTNEMHLAPDEPNDWLNVGITLYDELTPGQQMVMLHWAANHLLVNRRLKTRRAAVQDATIAAIFERIRSQIEVEIDFDSDYFEDSCFEDQADNQHWRLLTQRALAQCEWDETEWELECTDTDPLPNSESPTRDINHPDSLFADFDHWSENIDHLCNRLLDDRDFELASIMMDVAPSQLADAKKRLGMDAEYFTIVAEDPHSVEFAEIQAETRSLVRRKPR